MIKEKRATLEQFIKEQLIGPGGCNYRYSVFHTDDDVLNPECAYGEVLNTTPGSIYSSAILFPLQSKEDIQSSSIESNETDTAGNDYDDEDGINTNEDEIDEEKNFDHAEDIYSLGRRFPNKLGISCCLKESFANDSLRIVVSGRYYKKIKLASTLRIKVDDPDGFKSFINSDVFIKNVGKLVSIEHAELKITNGIPAAQLKQVRDGLREVNKYYCSKIATNQDGSICSIYNEPSFKPEYRFLSAYKERLFAKLNNFDLQGNYTCAGMQDEVQQRILEVEKIETYISYIEDVISVFDGKGFGYWEAIDFSKEIDLSGIDLTSKRVFKAEEHESLKGVINVDINEAVHLSLDVWLQSIRNNGKLYLKVLLVNSSTEITSGDVRYFSIVNERINERSFFGVSIDISSPHLIEYHPTGQRPDNLTAEERKVFNLVALRFIAAFYPDCEVSNTTVMAEVNGGAGVSTVEDSNAQKEEKYLFKVTGRQVLKAGWREVFAGDKQADDAEASENGEGEGTGKSLPAFVKGESGAHVPQLQEKTTTPPKYYTEATLLRAMETAGKTVEDEELRDAMKENGIGRPSTRAAIIEKLYQRKYIVKQGKSIRATEVGIELIHTIISPLLKSAELTGRWEKKLREIERGEYTAQQFLDELKQMTGEVVKEVKTNKAGMLCPVCRKGVIIRGRTRYGCSRWREGCTYAEEF